MANLSDENPSPTVPPSSAKNVVVIDGVELSVTDAGGAGAGDGSGGGGGGRHMPHPWMRADVAAAIRTIHNTKKATIRQHYYPEGTHTQSHQ